MGLGTGCTKGKEETEKGGREKKKRGRETQRTQRNRARLKEKVRKRSSEREWGRERERKYI